MNEKTASSPFDSADFAMTIEENGMNPTLQAGDIAFISAQDDVADTNIAVIANGNTAEVGFISHVGPDEVMLYSPSTRPRFFHLSDTCYILGEVIGITRAINKLNQHAERRRSEHDHQGTNSVVS